MSAMSDSAFASNDVTDAGEPAAPLQVFVLARPMFHEEQALAFLRENAEVWRQTPDSTPAELAVEFAGRICYMSFGERQSPRTTREYIHNLISQGHESVLEHVSWTFLLAGVSRSFTHQLVRHRVGFSFSQLSQQYHDERRADTVMPALVGEDDELKRLWLDAVSQARDAYRTLLDALDQRQDLRESHDQKERLRSIRTAARGVLPANTETKIVVTANARAIRHFLALRGDLLGDEEMRRVSVALLNIVSKDAPSMFDDFAIMTAADGGSVVRPLPLSN